MDTQNEQPDQPQAFAWHPVYAGRAFDDVRTELTSEISADQRQHKLAMDGAEEAEHDALASVVELERRWGQYDFDWAELDAGMLASKILAFEQERERRHELITWSEYRRLPEADQVHASETTTSSELSTRMKGLSLVALIVIVVIVLIVMALL